MPTYENVSTGLRVHRDDTRLDGFARWRRVDGDGGEAAEQAATEPDDSDTTSDVSGRKVARETSPGWYAVDGEDRKYRRSDLPDDVDEIVDQE